MGSAKPRRATRTPKVSSIDQDLSQLEKGASGEPDFDDYNTLLQNPDIVGPIITSPEEARSAKGNVEPLDDEPDYASLGYGLSNYGKPTVEPILETQTDRMLKQNIQSLSEDGVFKKPKPVKKLQPPGKRPAFIVKLWNMVNDPKNQEYINWMDSGDGFHVMDREKFMKYVLPQYFKHNNFASFVRQLNMYGFHKIQDVSHGSLAQSEEVWQFSNPDFKKGRQDLLDNIVRNKPKEEAANAEDEVDIKQLLAQLEIMKKNQKLIADDLIRVRRDNEMLWKENFLAREKHKLQSETLDKILRFLASVYGNNTSKLLDQVNNQGTAAGNLDLLPLQRNNKYQNESNWYENFADDLQQQQQGQNFSQQPPVQPLYPQGTGNKQPLMITERAHGSFSSSSSSRPKLDELTGGTPTDFNNNAMIQELNDSPLDKKFPMPIKQYSHIPSQPNTPELIIGNINQHLDDNDSAINQVNDWITRYTKPDESVAEGSSASLGGAVPSGEDFLQSPLDLNSPALDLAGDQFINSDMSGDQFMVGDKRPAEGGDNKSFKRQK